MRYFSEQKKVDAYAQHDTFEGHLGFEGCHLLSVAVGRLRSLSHAHGLSAEPMQQLASAVP